MRLRLLVSFLQRACAKQPDQLTLSNLTAAQLRNQILGAIEEATGKPAPERLGSLKKKELAAEAESMVTDTRWVPPTIRG